MSRLERHAAEHADAIFMDYKPMERKFFAAAEHLIATGAHISLIVNIEDALMRLPLMIMEAAAVCKRLRAVWKLAFDLPKFFVRQN